MYKLKNWVLSPIRMKKVEKYRIHKKTMRFVYNDRTYTIKELPTKSVT